MKRIVICLILVIGTTVMAKTDNELGLHPNGGRWKYSGAKNIDKSLPHVLLIGDSIMNSYRRGVKSKLEKTANVDTWSTGMHLNSPTLHDDLKKVLANRKYDLIHFNIGLHGWPEGRIPEGKYGELFQSYIDLMKAGAPDTKLVWATTTQVFKKGRAKTLDPVINPLIVERNKMALEIVNKEKLFVNDLNGLLSNHHNLSSGDGFHWSGKGNAMMVEHIVEVITNLLKKPVSTDAVE